MTLCCGQVPAATLSLEVTDGAGSQLSVAVASPVVFGRLSVSQSIVKFIGHVITGAVVSTTVMICSQLELFPHGAPQKANRNAEGNDSIL